MFAFPLPIRRHIFQRRTVRVRCFSLLDPLDDANRVAGRVIVAIAAVVWWCGVDPAG